MNNIAFKFFCDICKKEIGSPSSRNQLEATTYDSTNRIEHTYNIDLCNECFDKVVEFLDKSEVEPGENYR